MTRQTDRLNTALAGRYRVERHLGEGVMASVYLCEDLSHDRQVACKLPWSVARVNARSRTETRFRTW